jgi:hypothetical protein
MTKKIFKLKSLASVFILSVLIFSSLTTTLNPFYVLANSSDSLQPSNFGIPNIPNRSPNFPKINLMEKHYNYNFSTRNWEIDNGKSTTSFQEKDCSVLYSQGIKGIADYGDGISNNVIRAIESDPVMSADTSFQVGINSISYYYRDCFMQNQNAKNFQLEYATTLPGSPKNNTDYNAFRITSQDTPYSESFFTPANNPVFAYHFQYNVDFPEDYKSWYSDHYRDLTGLDRDYDGVAYSYTYYTYMDPQTNQYKTWANPNEDNSNSGWLIYGVEDNVNEVMPLKPVIYAYPKEEIDINIKVDYTGEFKFTYPKYNRESGWNVRVKPNGEMTTKDGKQYPYLFWDGKEYPINVNKNEGFVVKQENLVEFFEEKLDYMGLNPRERTDFITFWVPLMLEKDYYYINFANKEFDKMAPLTVSPKPDSTQRIFMVYEGLDERKEVKEQDLEKFERVDYSIIEWGGSKLY